jgi:hypothetical protein
VGHVGSFGTAIKNNKIDGLKRKKIHFSFPTQSFYQILKLHAPSSWLEAITQPDSQSQEPWLELELITNDY